MNGLTDRSNDFCKTGGSYFRQAAEAQKKLVEITMSKVSPDLVPGFTDLHLHNPKVFSGICLH